ncbi:peptidase [Cellulomonas endophytica]|uniref:peptidase n=1 Tax=Cellulomonas endophytica TaxID=2494735 RepID=UPI001010D97E|nr:peptidase [Cellulomonas endophytica]
MDRFVRFGATVLVAAGVGVATAAGAGAAVPAAAGCGTSDGYTAAVPCQVAATVVPECTDDAPHLDYAATVSGRTASTADVTFVNPDGEDVTYTGLPLQGSVPWPGSTVAADGRVTDWPGWTRSAAGAWRVGDDFAWATGSDLRVVVAAGGLSTTATVAYPSTGATCVPVRAAVLADPGTPAGGVRSAVLAATGAGVVPAAGVAAALVAVGAGAVALGRRRATQA